MFGSFWSLHSTNLSPLFTCPLLSGIDLGSLFQGYRSSHRFSTLEHAAQWLQFPKAHHNFFPWPGKHIRLLLLPSTTWAKSQSYVEALTYTRHGWYVSSYSTKSNDLKDFSGVHFWKIDFFDRSAAAPLLFVKKKLISILKHCAI